MQRLEVRTKRGKEVMKTGWRAEPRRRSAKEERRWLVSANQLEEAGTELHLAHRFAMTAIVPAFA